MRLNTSDSLITTLANHVEVFCDTVGVWKLCSTGSCCHRTGSNLSVASIIGLQPGDILDISSSGMTVDLSGAAGVGSVGLTGAYACTLVGRSDISFTNSAWLPNTLATMGNDVNLLGRYWPLMNWTGSNGSVPDDTVFLGNGSFSSIDLSGLPDPGDCYVRPKHPVGGLSFTTSNLGPCVDTCNDAKICTDPEWYPWYLKMWSVK